MYIYIYNGCKNRSTYSSYTAGFLQAQELSEALKPLKMDFPGFQDSGHADTHTQSYLHCLKSICFFHRSKSLSEQSEPLCCTYGRHWLVSTPVTYSICQWLLLFQLVWHPGCKVFVWWPLYKLSFWYTTSNLVPMYRVWCVDKGSMPRHRCSGR